MTVSFLVDGHRVLIDECDLIRVAEFRWHARVAPDTGIWYVSALIGKRRVYLHQLLVWPAGGILVDHANRDGLDNRKANLRLCSRQQNAWNSKLFRTNSFGYKGVTRHKGKWRATYRHRGRSVHVGYFATAEAARDAWVAAVTPIRREFYRAA